MSEEAAISASRVGRKPVTIPSGVDVKINDGELVIKGPKGQLTLSVHPSLLVVLEDDDSDDGKSGGKRVQIKLNSSSQYCRNGTGKKLLNAVPGTTRAEIYNAVHGVSKGFERKLNLVGVGYRAQVKGKVLHLTIGYSHPVEFEPPEGITIEAPSLTEILIKGSNKHLVGHTTAKIVDIRPPEPYKGKGIIDPRKPVIRKETKKK
jgi:large subunit ribosomal protein L6